MSKRQRTAEEVCVEYAIAVDEARKHHEIMKMSLCSVVDEAMRAYGALIESLPMEVDAPDMPNSESCLTKHWQIVLEGSGDYAREVPELAYEAMCSECKTRFQEFEDRREARKRLGAAKRAVGAVGKRLMAVKVLEATA